MSGRSAMHQHLPNVMKTLRTLIPHAWRLRLAIAVLLTVSAATPARAQDIVNLDQAIGRARALVEAGNGRAGRLVLDSLVQRTPVGTPALGELLYWRGLLSESGTEAERDWRRLLLEVPMSPRAEDALLRLAQLEQLRGRPAASRALLERMARDYSEPSSQARAHFWLAKAFFDENDRARACGALDIARRDAPSNAVELRTQMDDLRKRCTGVTAVAPIVVASVPAVRAPLASAPASAPVSTDQQLADTARADMLRRQAQRITADSLAAVNAARTDSAVAAATAARADSVRRAVAAAPTPRPTPAPAPLAATSPASTTIPANARYSVQLAAYQRLDQAQQLVRQLVTRNIDARVDGTVAPFRVRTGYFVTRAQAAARLAELKSQGHDGFVAERTP